MEEDGRRDRGESRIASAKHDVIVVGAGAAGLAAADALARAGRSVLVLEARSRIGGRCWTRRMPGLPVPVELGAEFIHGRAQATLGLLARAGVPGVDSTRTQRFLEHGRLREANAFVEAHKAVQHAALLKKRDLSFSDFLAAKKLNPKTTKLATMMVQGFDAADPTRVSAREIAEEWGSGALGSSQMRPQGGYGPLLETFLTGKFQVALGRPVREVRWQGGAVEIDGIRARHAIVTLPLGVLQSGSVRFFPEIEKQAALQKLASGPVVRVALRFREAFWEELCPGTAFFHSPEAPFPTFWTPLPMHAPLLTAWAGGPKAERLSGLPEKQLVRHALASVRSVLGRVPKVQGVLVQDWQADPYSLGAYSYVLVGGQGARQQLRRPLLKTLFFAGEATDTDEAGTVAGALRSGARAAREVLAT
ncbi:MAG TPA: NAD(P)/FAD-dependent oxidoreductase [Burkholderiales bacterium]|nr:NAD(P)/FAD-dependent oxidoreductase [Burkholderiales bacterium]